MRRAAFVAALCVAAGLTVLGVAALFGRHMARLDEQKSSFLRLALHLPLQGVEGRIDHLALDARGHRLFIAALGNGSVEAMDTRTGRRAPSLSGFQEPQGIAFDATGQRLYVAASDGTTSIVDAATMRRVRSIRLGSDADNVRLDAARRQVLVGFGGGALATLDTTRFGIVNTVRLPGHPEGFALDSSGRWVYVNVPSAGMVAVVDRRRNALVRAIPLKNAGDNFPIALDEAGRRLFVACRRPSVLLSLDTASGTEAGRVPIGRDPDDVWYDAARRRLYVSCGEGVVSVVQRDAEDGLTHVGDVATAPGARTSLFVPPDGRLYVAVPHRGEQIAEIKVFEVVK